MDDDRVDAGDLPHGRDTRTDAWYWTRMELGLGVEVVVVLLVALIPAPPSPCFGCVDAMSLGPLLISEGVLGPVALALAAVGLIWMIRIFRGSHDEPPSWRYRDR